MDNDESKKAWLKDIEYRTKQAIWLQNVEERLCDCSVKDGEFFEPNPELHDAKCEYRTVAR